MRLSIVQDSHDLQQMIQGKILSFFLMEAKDLDFKK